MFTHAHASMITYRVDVYRNRPIGASLLTSHHKPSAGYLAPKGLHTGWLGVVTGIRLLQITVFFYYTVIQIVAAATGSERRRLSSISKA